MGKSSRAMKDMKEDKQDCNEKKKFAFIKGKKKK